MAAPATPTAITGAHQGTPSGPIRVKEKMAVSAISTLMIGTSAASSAGTCGLACGAVRRSAAIRVATPSAPLSTLAR